MATLQQKKAAFEGLFEELKDARIIVVADYRGLTVAELTDLRKQLREQQATLTVAKNTIMRRVIQGTPVEGLSASLSGPTAVLVGKGDQVAPIKVIRDYLKKNKKPNELRGGYLDGSVLDAKEVLSLADLPSKEVLLAQLVGCINAPLSGLAMVIQGPQSALVRALGQIADQKKLQEGAA
ncbi:MAG: 50S ribosomal protein L10 [Candidatus Melainabacteria bacterium]|nr:50S ribosomal protein L10 [Candidatus Melainabacteria bacterium]